MGVWDGYFYSRGALCGAKPWWCRNIFVAVALEHRIFRAYSNISSGEGGCRMQNNTRIRTA